MSIQILQMCFRSVLWNLTCFGFMCSLLVAILPAGEFQYFIVLGEINICNIICWWLILITLLLRCRVWCKTG